MWYPKHYLTICFLLLSFPAFSEEPKATNAQVLKDFAAAFNAHDSDAMSKFVTEDVQWLSISADKITVETNGKAALVASMNNYFKMCSTCQSVLIEVMPTQDRVSAIEEASWQGKNGLNSQRSLAVYEFSEGLIKRVYYFPTEK